MRHRDSMISQSLKNIRIKDTGTRTSLYMCKEIIKQWSASEALLFLELGAGDGMLTKQILKKMSQDSRLIALEADPACCKLLNEIDDKRLTVIPIHIFEPDFLLMANQSEPVDYVLSTMSLTHLPEKDITILIQNCYDRLKEGGQLIQVQYSSITKKIFEQVFGLIQIKFLPFNIPPAFLWIMRKTTASLDGNKF